MSASLSNVATTSAWLEVPCPGTVRLRISVFNAAIEYQCNRDAWGAGTWEDASSPLAPGLYSLDETCSAVRFRSLVAAEPARLFLKALTAEEVGE